MNKLVSKLRFQEFIGERERNKLEDYLDYIQPTKYLVANNKGIRIGNLL